ncbi:MAG: hypothetical protein DI537_41590 [Stutzerimonas stutzeri]|nr:MAG: hypothetical protein DI537_41590 [Stutzerimonas stutzeri]
MISKNRHFNSPAMAQAAASLSSLFAPPMGAEGGADPANYALADARRAEMNNLGRLMDYTTDPNFQQEIFDRMGQATGRWNPANGYYGVNMSNETSRVNNAADNARALAERQMIEEATTQRLGIPDVNARYKVDSEAAVSGSNNLRDNQTKAITTLLGPLDPGQVRPEVAADLMGLLEMPAIGPAAGAPKVLSETEQAAAERQRLIEAGVLTDDMLLDDFLGQRAPVQGVGPDGKTGAFLSPGAAIRTGAQPLPKDSGPGVSMTMPDGTVVQVGNKPMTGEQQRGVNYAATAAQMLTPLDELGDTLTGLSGKLSEGVPVVGNYAQSEEYQRARVLGERFVQSVLRNESGAATPADEVAKYQATLLPQPGDKPGTVQYKSWLRKVAVSAMESGFTGDQVKAKITAAIAAGPPPEVAAPEQNAPAASSETAAQVYATNPQTGQRLVLRNGAWEPAQ